MEERPIKETVDMVLEKRAVLANGELRFATYTNAMMNLGTKTYTSVKGFLVVNNKKIFIT